MRSTIKYTNPKYYNTLKESKFITEGSLKDTRPYFTYKYSDNIKYHPRNLLDFEEYRAFLQKLLHSHIPFVLHLDDIIDK